jgi:quercetin dioxygenase-like cupin family protein
MASMNVTLRNTLIAAALLAAAIGASIVLAREPGEAPKVEAQQLYVQELAGDPTKEVNAQIYSFPPGAEVPWHIHPDAHEIAYVIQGTFTFERAGEAPKEIKAGASEYLPPNIVHRGMNKGTETVKLFVVRIKPKDKPLTTEVPAP